MTRQLSVGEAREQISHLAEQFERDKAAHLAPEPITATRYGKPIFTILPHELDEAIIETLEVLSDQEQMQAHVPDNYQQARSSSSMRLPQGSAM